MTGLEALFARTATLLGDGLRGPGLGAAFREAFDPDAAAHLDELGRLVAAALRGLGLGDWSGARLGEHLADHPRLGDPACVAQLALELATGEGAGDGDAGLGWLGGPLFRSGRLDAYLRAAEEDPGKAMAYLSRNLRSELQHLRRRTDPEGAALYDDLLGAAGRLVEAGRATLAGARLELAPDRPGRPVPLDPDAAAEALLAGGALAPFLAAVARNAARDGGRNTPMRGAPFEQPLADGLWALVADGPPDGPSGPDTGEPAPGPRVLDLSALANRLRGAWDLPPSWRTHGLPADEDDRPDPGALGPDPAALEPAELVEDGPGAIGALLGPWRAALAEAPSLGDARRARLAGYLDATERLLRDHLGDPPPGWRAELRRALGAKPQTWSDDWKLLDGLLVQAGGTAPAPPARTPAPEAP